jgi:hypothetical protein
MSLTQPYSGQERNKGQGASAPSSLSKKSFGFFGRRPQVAGCRVQKKGLVLYGIILYTHINPRLLGTKPTGEKKC